MLSSHAPKSCLDAIDPHEALKPADDKIDPLRASYSNPGSYRFLRSALNDYRLFLRPVECSKAVSYTRGIHPLSRYYEKASGIHQSSQEIRPSRAMWRPR